MLEHTLVPHKMGRHLLEEFVRMKLRTVVDRQVLNCSDHLPEPLLRNRIPVLCAVVCQHRYQLVDVTLCERCDRMPVKKQRAELNCQLVDTGSKALCACRYAGMGTQVKIRPAVSFTSGPDLRQGGWAIVGMHAEYLHFAACVAFRLLVLASCGTCECVCACVHACMHVYIEACVAEDLHLVSPEEEQQEAKHPDGPHEHKDQRNRCRNTLEVV